MFSIAAINDTDQSKSHWEPLAPTKEAQEFRLTQMYQEGLLQQQAGEYVKAQNLFLAIIQDPLCTEAETKNLTIHGSMLQLRYLTLKNLAEAYLKQGSNYYNDALRCYLNAVDIDGKDVVLWNRLGTLACSLGSFNIARRAFENGLHCSLNHWGCMEKLVEVLIAIGDEAACLVVVKQLLKVSPLHPRAELIRQVLEENVEISRGAEPCQSSKSNFVTPRGIDKLKPQHSRFSVLEKRKTDHLEDRDRPSKRRNCHKFQIHVEEASWIALISSVMSALKEYKEKDFTSLDESSLNTSGLSDELDAAPRTWVGNACVTFCLSKTDNLEGAMLGSHTKRIETVTSYDTVKHMYARVSGNENVADNAEDVLLEKRQKLEAIEGAVVCNEGGTDRIITLKERDTSTDEEPPYLERRSTRLESLRTRKFERGEDIENMESELAKAKVYCKTLRQSLEPFILCYEQIEKIPVIFSDTLEFEKTQNYSDEENEVLHFLEEHVNNSGLYHIAHNLLERTSFVISKPISSWIGVVELERLSRSCVQERSACCSLFLAEIYMDLAAFATEKCEVATLLRDCEYNLCRVLESATLNMPSFLIAWDKEPYIWGTSNSKNADKKDLDEPSKLHERSSSCAEPDYCWSFWVRYYWLSGRLRNAMGNFKKGEEDFERCLEIFKGRVQVDRDSANILLQHCRVDKEISPERVSRKLHELQIEDLLQHTAAKMLEQSDHTDLIKLLAPILLPEGDGEEEKHLSIIGKKNVVDFSAELSALNMLVTACENSRPKDYIVALQCYERRLEIYGVAAGFLNSKDEGHPHTSMQEDVILKSEHTDSGGVDWFKMVADEVKSISRCAAHLREMILESSILLVPDGRVLGRLQQLLLTIMCHIVMMLSMKKCSGLASSDMTDQLEATCFVDAASTFCRLQHLYPAISMEQQVGLLGTMHEVLAGRGLCCAGKACEGGEGAFLKMAIKHLLSLEMKLKVVTSTSTYLNKDQVSDATENNVAEGSSLRGMPLSLEEKGEIGRKNEIECSIQQSKETVMAFPSNCQGPSREDEIPLLDGKVMGIEEAPARKKKKLDLSVIPDGQDVEKRKEQLGLDMALDQSFFCLYGLNLRGGLESASQDGLAVHSNTSLGDYQTKEQCADVFQYLLPYAKVCSRASLLKLRKVLRAIRKQFPEPPASILENNALDMFLDSLEFDEDRLRDMVLSGQDVRDIFKFVCAPPGFSLKNSENESRNEASPVFMLPHFGGTAADCTDSLETPGDAYYAASAPYFDVYSSLYYLLTQVEEISAGDKCPGFVFTKEGEEFVEHNVRLFKYDLLYNPLRFESWQKLANIYDEEVDLMLNDGSKTCNAALWRNDAALTGRVENTRRHSRRCLLMSLALAKTPEQQSQAHELLALVYYDTLQNVVPSYDQRQHVATRDSRWKMICQNSFRHFEKAFAYKPEWSHPFYLGKLAEKLGQRCEVALVYYRKAADMNPCAVDPFYRIHASRMKLLCSGGSENLDVIKVVARFCYLLSNEEKVFTLLEDFQLSISRKGATISSAEKVVDHRDSDGKLHENSLSRSGGYHIKEAWQCLFEDCIKALEACLEGELKHFHKARFRLAQGLLARNEGNDIERAKEELAFCFKSSRSPFTINMWEIDGSTKRNRRKTPGAPGCKRGLELSMPESSRKFITCLRKYLLLYLYLCEKTTDLCTLERAYSSLRADKRFSFCLADLINVAHGKYIYTLGAAICRWTEIADTSSNSYLKSMLERVFSSFMEHGSSWSDIAAVSLAEAGLSSAPEVSEMAIYGYIHQYIFSLKAENRVDVLESVNEKIRKRLKGFKLVNAHCDQVCKHAALSWCQALCCALSSITPMVLENSNESSCSSNIDQGSHLFVELCSHELLANPYEAYSSRMHTENSTHSNPISSMKGVWIKQASMENMEKALTLLKQTHTFYRDCAGPFPVGINLFLRSSGTFVHSANESVANMASFGPFVVVDLSVPRKLLLWAYTLVHGRTCTISEAVKFCEDQAKTKIKRGMSLVGPSSSVHISQERNLGSGTKIVPSSGCQVLMNVISVDDREKPKLDEHENICGGSSSMLPSSCNVHACSSHSGSTKQYFEEVNQTDEGCVAIESSEHQGEETVTIFSS